MTVKYVFQTYPMRDRLSISHGPHPALGVPCPVCQAEFGECCEGFYNNIVHQPRSRRHYEQTAPKDTEGDLW